MKISILDLRTRYWRLSKIGVTIFILYILLANGRLLSANHSDGVVDIMKCVQWNLVSLDILLDFILTESKLLLTNSEIQNIVIGEFQRRFQEEFSGIQAEQSSKQLTNNKKSNDFNVNNIASSNNNTEAPKKSFTAEFLLKLISKFNFFY